MFQSVEERTRIKNERYESGVILTLKWVTGMLTIQSKKVMY